MAYVLALLAACTGSAVPVLQQLAAARAPERLAMSPRLLGYLMRRPLWLLGIGVLILGSVFHALALYFGAMVAVEPVLATNVVFAVALTAFRDRKRPRPSDWTGAIAVSVGVATLLVALAPRAGSSDAVSRDWGIAGLAVGAYVTSCYLVARAVRDVARSALLGSATGAGLAIQDAMNRASSHLIEHDGWRVLLHWQPWTLVCVGAAAFTMQQFAHRAASVPASQPALLSTRAVFAMLFGALALGERVRTDAAALTVAALAIVVAAGGTVLLSRSSLARRETTLAAHPERT